MKSKTLLLISQVYVPDPAAVGQYMAEVGEEMASRGWTVKVLTSGRGYDDPSLRFPGREEIGGVSVRRLPFSSLGKKTIFHRLLGQLAFCLQATLIGLFTRRLGGILVTTSPPMGGAIGVVISLVRRTPLSFWVMDLNPDQAIAQGMVKADSLVARVFDGFNRVLLKRARAIVALDRFMAAKLSSKVAGIEAKIHVLPPWPMEGALERISKEENPFCVEHDLADKFVLMYSGNHSLVHPLETFLAAAEGLRDEPRVVFAFVGGGKAKEPIDQMLAEGSHPNIVSLPYQPLDQIKYSLSAADVHLVSMGEPMVGCVHPCKVYGAMALAKPVLYLGPMESHIGDELQKAEFGFQVDHGDVDGMVETIRGLLRMRGEELEQLGLAGRERVDGELRKERIIGEFCGVMGG